MIITMDFQIVYDIVMHKRNVYQFNEETLENDKLCKKKNISKYNKVSENNIFYHNQSQL